MRILMLAQFYPPISGGEERHVANLSMELAKRGHTVAVATLRQPGLTQYEQPKDIKVFSLPGMVQRVDFFFRDPQRRHAAPFPDPETTLALRRIVREFKPDIVHAHNWLVYSYLPLKNWAGIPLVMTLHDYSLVCAIKRLMFKDQELCSGPAFRKCMVCTTNHYGKTGPPTYLLNQLMGTIELGLVDHYIAVSHATAQGNGLSPEKAIRFTVIPNFLPDDFDVRPTDGHPLTQQLPDGDFLLYAGDLSRDKGVPVLLDAYQHLEISTPLVLIGRQTETTPENLPPNVVRFNLWPHEAVLEAWRRSSIALAPSIWAEPFGFVVIEAMAAGKPVIASRIGAFPDIVEEGQTGLLVTPGRPAELCAAIHRLLQDPALRAEMGKAGRQRVERFRASQVVPQIEQVYHDLLGTKVEVFRNGDLAGGSKKS